MAKLPRSARGSALVLSAWLWALPAVAQVASGSQPASASVDQSPQGVTQQSPAPAAAPEYPSLHMAGFANIDFAAQNKSAGTRGFSEGQFVLHFAAALSPHVSTFSELSFTPRADAGTGTPSATGFNAEVERLIIRFDRSDQLKV